MPEQERQNTPKAKLRIRAPLLARPLYRRLLAPGMLLLSKSQNGSSDNGLKCGNMGLYSLDCLLCRGPFARMRNLVAQPRVNRLSVTKIEHCSDIGHGQDKIPLRSSTRVGGIEQKYH